MTVEFQCPLCYCIIEVEDTEGYSRSHPIREHIRSVPKCTAFKDSDLEELLLRLTIELSNQGNQINALQRRINKLENSDNSQPAQGSEIDEVNLPNLTDKQREAYRVCMSSTGDSKTTKRQLKKKLITAGIYKDDYQAKKTLKFFLQNNAIPLTSRGEQVINIYERDKKER